MRPLVFCDDGVPLRVGRSSAATRSTAILFGLSMDYEVFLPSRIREEYGRTGDLRGSVADGLAATARVITAAALIMIAVFLACVGNPEPVTKMVGLGLAAAVLIDATLVRCCWCRR